MLRELRTARAGCHRQTTSRGVVPRRPAFTLLELLASIAIIALVISIMLPSMSVMKERARRIKCAATIHQQGAALAMWADTRGRDELPASHAGHGSHQGTWTPQTYDNLHLAETMCVYRSTSQTTGIWDGMGKLYEYDYLEAPEAFYCPSHDGQHPYERYQEVWANPGGQRIYGNYHYRGVPWEFISRKFSQLLPDVTLLTDGMRTVSDFSHVDGCNMLKADLSVRWFEDTNGVILSKLALLEDPLSNSERSEMYLNIWQHLDSNGGKTSSNVGDYDSDYLGSFPDLP
jgi:prepilin-type N-terminal cleavage/methylation domain-containing protein